MTQREKLEHEIACAQDADRLLRLALGELEGLDSRPLEAIVVELSTAKANLSRWISAACLEREL